MGSTTKIFISSPSDVRPERLIAERVVQRLDREFSVHFHVEPVLWEREPLVATGHFQDGENIPPPSTTSIVVVILWSRIGVHLPADRFSGAVSGRRPVTGTEWEFEEALAAHRAGGSPDLIVYKKDAPVMAALDDESALDDIRGQKKSLQEFMQRWFIAEDGTFVAALQNFRNATEFEEKLEEDLRRLLRRRISDNAQARAAAAAANVRWHQGSPFRGLESFDLSHAPVFFGRTRARNELRDLLIQRIDDGCAFLLVMGASGSGKSSLVKAGLMSDLLLPGMIGTVALCRSAQMRPADGAANPIDTLAGQIIAAVPELTGLGQSSERLTKFLRADPTEAAFMVSQGLARAAEEAKLTDRAQARLVLLIDQFEELFTGTATTDEDRQLFIAALDAFARSGHVWVVATMRSDFFHWIEKYPALAQLSASGRYLVTPPAPAELSQIIRQPAREAGLVFDQRAEDGYLNGVILAAAVRDPSALPLLEFLLDQLWQRRRPDGTLTFDAYEELGGLEGALGRRAMEEYESLAPEVRAALPRVLRSLVAVGQSAEAAATARQAPLSGFPEGSPERALVDACLAPKARLFIAAGDGDKATVRVAHEALLTHWELARALIVEARGDLQLRGRLEEGAEHWAGAGRDASLLLRPGRQLSEAQDLMARRCEELGELITGFIAASSEAEQADRNRLAEEQRKALSRARKLAVVFGALASLALAGAWFGYAGQRDAEHNFDAAVDAADAMVGVVAKGLQNVAGVPAVKIRDVLRQAETLFDKMLSQSSNSVRLLHRQAVMRMTFADAYASLGETEAQLASARDANVSLAELARRRPSDRSLQRDLAVSFIKIGNVQRARGDLGAALEAYQRAVAARGDAAEPDADLAEMHSRIGDIYTMQGAFDKGLASYRTVFTMLERLAAQDPARRRDLAAAHDRIGFALERQDHFDQALAEYQAGLEIRRAVADQSPADSAMAAEVSVSQERLADIYRQMGDFDRALEQTGAGLAIRETLARQDPTNAQWQTDLLVMLGKQGDLLADLGRLSEAEQAYRAAFELARHLAEKDPTNSERQSQLATSYDRLGDVLAANAEVALTNYRASLAIYERLVARDPSNADWQTNLLGSRQRVGGMLLDLGRLDEAQTALRAAVNLATRLAEADRGDAGRRHNLATCQSQLGDVLRARGDLAAAQDAYQTSLAIAESVAKESGGNAGRERDLLLGNLKVGDVQFDQGQLDQALRSYRAGLTVASSLAERSPADPSGQQDLSVAWDRVAKTLLAQEKTEEAQRAAEASLEVRRAMLGRDPSNPDAQRALSFSWNKMGDVLLAMHLPDASLEAYRNGLALRGSLLAADPDNPFRAHDLAVSHQKIAAVLREQSNRAAALEEYQTVQAILQKLVQQGSANEDWKKELAKNDEDMKGLVH